MSISKLALVGFCGAFLYVSLVVSSIGVANQLSPTHWSLSWVSSRIIESTGVDSLPYGQSLASDDDRRPFSLSLSTAENYKANDRHFHGEHATIRSQLDYSYHGNFIKSRQLVQDKIIDSMLNRTRLTDSLGNVCDTPTEPWIVFTAGAMGAGKSYTVRQLAAQGKFPLDSFVTVDPDEIRRHLPEFQLYAQKQPERAGELTRLEAGYIAEILTKTALHRRKNVLVDGSLRDSEWYKQYFGELRQKHVNLRIGILHVTAPRSAVFQRAKDRSKTTGRVVPNETIEMALAQVPESIEVLRPLTDFFSELHNAPGSTKLELRTEGQTWESFRQAWVQTCLTSSFN